METATAVET